MFPLKDTQPSYTTPFVTIALIAVNVLIFLFEWSLEPFARNHLIETYALVPAQMEISTLFTSMFLHGSWMHLLGNMWFLWVFGDNIEDTLGHARYIAFYVLSGLAAGIVHVFLNPGSAIPTVGASGAIAGVMGGYMVRFPHSRILTLAFIFFFVTTFEVPALVMMGYWFLIQLFSGLGSIARTSATTGGVAWFAHVGGFLAGMLLIKMMGARARYSRRRDIYW